jgi:peptidase E
MRPIQPIYLLADSQLLFWRNGRELFLSQVRRRLGKDNPAAAYVGASNGDDPEFYSIFLAAMAGVGISDCRMIKSSFAREDKLFFERADIILLAGGDVQRGWEVIDRVGIKEALVRQYHVGAALFGLSAGAIQLGLHGYREGDELGISLFDALRLVPFSVDVHEQRSGWKRLRTVIRLLNSSVKGMGIPSGGGMTYHPDHTVEPLKHPVHEFSVQDQKLTHRVLIPEDDNVQAETSLS